MAGGWPLSFLLVIGTLSLPRLPCTHYSRTHTHVYCVRKAFFMSAPLTTGTPAAHIFGKSLSFHRFFPWRDFLIMDSSSSVQKQEQQQEEKEQVEDRRRSEMEGKTSNDYTNKNDTGNGNRKKMEKMRKKKKKGSKIKYKKFFANSFGCWMIRVEKDREGNFDMEVVNGAGGQQPQQQSDPTHLVVMVNGIIGSAEDWKFAAKQFLKRYPRDVVVHCSQVNYSTLTFDGVDVMGGRLAEEVISVIERHPSVQKISFIGHSLGGLIARYAIAKLYGKDVRNQLSQENGDSKTSGSGDTCTEEKMEAKIAGLEPINFITSATPHLGSRWHKQVPLFCGSHRLEKLAARISWLLGRTGKHLFLTDGENGRPPLLLQMAHDTEQLKFLSALQSFKRRVAYANAGFDHLVGWSTSSLRHRTELPKRRYLAKDDRYPHIVHMEPSKSASPRQEVSSEKEADGSKVIDMEEEMLSALTKMNWERVDVYFKGSTPMQRFLAHSTIQVNSAWLNSDGADVIQHTIDNFVL